jgi:hypothetical protein
MSLVAMTAVGAASYALTNRNREKFLSMAEERLSELTGADAGGAAGEEEGAAAAAAAHSAGSAAGAGSGAVWDKRDVRKLRARKLLSLADEETLTTSDLRALFRLLDEDGNHEVSA